MKFRQSTSGALSIMRRQGTTIPSAELDKESGRLRALELIDVDGHGVGTRLAHAVGVSRQVANSYLQALERDGLVEATGTTRAKTYKLRTLARADIHYPREGLQEDLVWRELIAPVVARLPQGVRDIWHYASTEMINNAIDHSRGTDVHVGVRRNALRTEVVVADDCEGIFLKIQRALGLHDTREALLELAKGKLTTAPANHSGEGIFFTSRMVDDFDIVSGNVHFTHGERRLDRISEQDATAPGTTVVMRLANDSARAMKDVFDRFADPEDYTFDRTVVPIRLAQREGEKLVARSQAKRVAHRFERFRNVVLDFTGVEEIGQAFADEIFRVFAASHPDTRIVAENTMIRRALAAVRNTN